MTEKPKEIENSSSSTKEIKSSQISLDIFKQTQNITKKKYYYLYKNGKKYILKKREKEMENITKEIKEEKTPKITNIEMEIQKKFYSKYDKMPNYYNTFISSQLMHSMNSHIVALFKEYLIYDDIFEFLTKYYSNRKSNYLLKEIINFYITNNIIYPNYVILPEGNYIYRNIQQKQRIIDNQEENLKKKKKEEKNKNKIIQENKNDEKVLNSKVMDSILNQTDTSEARNCFGINNNGDDDEDDNNINLLIDNIDKAENIKKKNNIFQKKKLIRIVNSNINSNNISRNNKDNDNKKENYFFKMCQYMNNNNLYFTVKNINENIYKESSYKISMIPKLLSTISRYKNIDNKDINTNYINGHLKMNTIDTDTITPRNKYFFLKDSKDENSDSKNSNNSPYVIKKPIKQSILYNKSPLYNSQTYNNTVYLKKNKKCLNNFIEEENAPKIYTKKNSKIFRINTDTNIDKITKTLDIDYKHINKNISEKKYGNLASYIKHNNMNIINYNNEDEVNIYNKINNNTKTITNFRGSLSNNKTNYKNSTINYSNHTFKRIAKMIKRKYIIDDELNLNSNVYNTLYNSQNKIVYDTPVYSKNHSIKFEKNKEIENNSKNIYISNNITNNNYYTIGNESRKDDKLLIKRYSKKTEINKRKMNKILNLKNRNEKMENIFTEPNIYYSNTHTTSKSNNIKDNIIDNSKRLIKKAIISPYKNGLINKTTLKSLDKYSLRYLLNKFNSKDKYENKNKNKLNINIENYQNNTKFKTINNKNDTKIENKTKLKKRYLILRDNKNNTNMRNIKRNNQINKLEINNINQKNEYFKTIETNTSNKLTISSLSTKNNNRNNKIKFYD